MGTKSTLIKYFCQLPLAQRLAQPSLCSASRRMPPSTPASAEIGYLHSTVALQHLDRDLDDAELHELESFLDSPRLADTAMDLNGIDGYFAAILSGPRTLMPSEWMPSIWDPNDRKLSPEFETLEHANRILGLLMRHYNTVARVLMDEPEELVPIYLDGDLGGAASWCSGYLAGMRFDRESWAKLLATKPRWIAPILCLGTRNEDGKEPDFEQAERWSREVGRSAARIHAYWLERRRAQPAGFTPDRFPAGSGPRETKSSRVGRNDLCPCGSGKKFKRCCGESKPA